MVAPGFPELSYQETRRTNRDWKLRANGELWSGAIEEYGWRYLWKHHGLDGAWEKSHVNFVRADDRYLTEIVPFKINWSYDDKTLVEAFAQWIRHFRPSEFKATIPRRHARTGKGSAQSQATKGLKALGAWRLLAHYKGNSTRARAHAGVAEALGLDYQNNPSSWSDAKRLVRSLYAKLSSSERAVQSHARVLAWLLTPLDGR